jgi:hypothetical protein
MMHHGTMGWNHRTWSWSALQVAQCVDPQKNAWQQRDATRGGWDAQSWLGKFSDIVGDVVNQHRLNTPKIGWLDWFKGKSTGNHNFYH